MTILLDIRTPRNKIKKKETIMISCVFDLTEVI